MGVVVREKEPGSGVWWIFVNNDGRRTSRRIGDRKLAREVAQKVRARLALGEFQLEERDVPTFKEYAQRWLDLSIRALRRPSTAERYEIVLRKNLCPAIGKMPLTKITRPIVRDVLLKAHAQGLSRSSVGLIRDVLSGVMGQALEDELISANPVSGVTKRMHLERVRPPVEAFNREEVDTILAAARKFYPELYVFFFAAFWTGLRLGELCGLQWDDVDWKGGFIEVRRAVRQGSLSQTKTGKSRRVELSDDLQAAMREHFTETKRAWLEYGQEWPWVWQRDNRPLHGNSVRNVWKSLLRRAEMRHVKFHATRHTYARELLAAGAPVNYVKDQLGHSSIQMTVDIYGCWMLGSGQRQVNRLDRKKEKERLFEGRNG